MLDAFEQQGAWPEATCYWKIAALPKKWKIAALPKKGMALCLLWVKSDQSQSAQPSIVYGAESDWAIWLPF